MELKGWGHIETMVSYLFNKFICSVNSQMYSHQSEVSVTLHCAVKLLFLTKYLPL
jgi:hypothetical protein